MTEGRELTAVLDGHLDERLAERMIDAAAEGSREERVRNAVETAVEIAEMDPDGTREALWALRSDRPALEHLEAGLDMTPARAILALGAAIQLAGAELASQAPDLRSRMPELLCWLEGAW